MGRSRGRGKSEVENLRGQVRSLQKELKYYRKRAHIETTIIDEEEPLEVEGKQCPECKGLVVSYDFRFIMLDKCSECEYQLRKKK